MPSTPAQPDKEIQIRLYTDGILGLYGRGEDNAYEVYLRHYPNPTHLGDERYIRDCARRDFEKALTGNAVYQDVYDRLKNSDWNDKLFKRYLVKVDRTSTRTAVVQIQALDEDAAREMALDQCGDIDFRQFSESTPVYDVVDVETVGADEKRSEPITRMVPDISVTEPSVDSLFREALAWGKVYGPQFSLAQWDRLRDEMAAQFTSRLRAMQETAATAPMAALRTAGQADRKYLVQLTEPQREKLLALIRNATTEPHPLIASLEAAVRSDFEVNIALGIEGDWAQGASANCPVNLVVLDHDLDETHPDHARLISTLVDPEEALELVNRALEKEEGGEGDDDDDAATPSAPRD